MTSPAPQESPLCTKCGYNIESSYNWKAIYFRWKQHKVKQVDVFEFDPLLHEARWWFHKANKYCIPINDTPKNGTAKHLVKGIVNANNQIYAAFALHTTLMNNSFWNKHQDIQFASIVNEALSSLDTRKGLYWTGGSKHVIPHVASQSLVSKAAQDKDTCWCGYIDAAATMWNDLALQWAVLKYPLPVR